MRQFRAGLTLFALLGFLFGTQAHLGLLQMTAWSGMLLTRAPNQGIEKALESTFSGEEPCCLCQVVAEQSQSPEPIEAPQVPFESELKLSNTDPSVEVTERGYSETTANAFDLPRSSIPPVCFSLGVDTPPPEL